jgi:hypothetical protein
VKRAVLAIVSLALLLGATPAPSPDPYAIFANARIYWERQHYPAYVAYTVAVDVLEAGTHKVEHYDSTYDATRGIVHVDPVSDYERAHPPSGRGVNLLFGIQFAGIKLGRPEAPIDFMGVPQLAPNYSFGIATFVPASKMTSAELVQQIRAQFRDPAPSPTPDATSSLHEIATVTAFKRNYKITLVGIETVDGVDAYHLQLKPLQDPHRYRLRDVWIDTQTYATQKLASDGNFVDGPGPGAPWTVTFVNVGDAHYISEEHTAASLAFRGLRYVETTVRFENIHPQTALFLQGLYEPQSPDDVLREPND